MMTKPKSSKWVQWKLLFLVPVMAILLFFISCGNKEDALKSVTEGISNEVPPPPPPPPPPVEEKDIITNVDSVKDVFKIVKEPPVFPGGEDALRKYVAENTKYPAKARENGIQGKIYVRFVVKSDGSVDNVSSVRKDDPLLEAEAIRVIKTLPKFKPGIHKGNPVNVWYTLPISFTLSNDKSLKVVKESAKNNKGPNDLVEEAARFPGDEKALQKFIIDNLKYPPEAKSKNIQGKVYIQFMVKKDGSVEEVKSLKAVNPLLEAEAIRIVKSIPKFTPAKIKGVAVDTWLTIPIVFSLQPK